MDISKIEKEIVEIAKNSFYECCPNGISFEEALNASPNCSAFERKVIEKENYIGFISSSSERTTIGDVVKSLQNLPQDAKLDRDCDEFYYIEKSEETDKEFGERIGRFVGNVGCKIVKERRKNATRKNISKLNALNVKRQEIKNEYDRKMKEIDEEVERIKSGKE